MTFNTADVLIGILWLPVFVAVIVDIAKSRFWQTVLGKALALSMAILPLALAIHIAW